MLNLESANKTARAIKLYKDLVTQGVSITVHDCIKSDKNHRVNIVKLIKNVKNDKRCS